MASTGNTVKVVVEYKFTVGDPKAASVIADLLRGSDGTGLTENYTIWDFDLSEKVIEATVE